MESASIKDKLIRGSLWNSVSQFGTQILNMAITVILARLLAPGDFGLFGMVVLITSFIGYFSEFGLTPGLIQKRDIDDLDTNSVFWTSIAFSCLLYLIIFISAPLISLFYNEPSLTRIARVAFLMFLVMPFCMIPQTLEQKALRYDKITIADILSLVISGAITIAMAFSGMGVWSLVWQGIMKTLFYGVILSFLTRWKPKLQWSWRRVRPLLRTGIDFTVNNLLQYTSDNTDYLLVGKLLGKAPLGLYTMAFRISKYPISKLESVFIRMLFPAFSSFNDDPERIKRNYIRILIFFLGWITPLLILGYFAVDPLVRILLGTKWIEIIPLVKIFMIYLLFSSFCIQNNPIMNALKKVRTLNQVQLLSTLALAGVGFFGIKIFGLIGMSYAFSAVAILSMAAVFILLLHASGLCVRDITHAVFPIVAKDIVIGLILWLASVFIVGRTSDPWIQLIAIAALFLAIFAGTSRKQASQLWAMIKKKQMN